MIIENIPKEYFIDERGQSSCQYYVAFCTKYNRRVFTVEYESSFKQIMYDVTKEKGITLFDIIVNADSVQCVINCPPDISIQKCINSIKIMAARKMHEKHPELKTRMPQIWTKKNFISSMGTVSYNSVCSYIESQKEGSK